MAQKPSIPKGTRDFPPQEMVKRNYIFETIRSVFKLYGYQPIETPAMENLNTLMGKYGEEGDRLIFKILNSGDFMNKVSQEDIENLTSVQLSGKLCEKALRYDLTVPFARFVVQHRNEISFPFKRYQIQPVWRADRPQKGRYREFFQCDADVVGSNSLINEVELVQIIDAVFTKLNVNTCVKINNRKILSGIAEYIDAPEKIVDITVAIDKLEKIGIDKVNDELRSKEISEEAIAKLQPIINLSGTTEEKCATMRDVLKDSEIGLKGVEEIEFVFSALKQFDLKTEVELDLTLARGLNYYTGAIFEVKALDVSIGSICGGGRYDDLTGIFGMPDVSGVGISFGADRIFDVLNQLDLYPSEVHATTKLLFLNFGQQEAMHCLKLCSDLRKQGISSDLYADKAKIKKQMNYANSKNVPYVALIGEDEMTNNTITLKNMETGEQQSVTFDELVNILQ